MIGTVVLKQGTPGDYTGKIEHMSFGVEVTCNLNGNITVHQIPYHNIEAINVA